MKIAALLAVPLSLFCLHVRAQQSLPLWPHGAPEAAQTTDTEQSSYTTRPGFANKQFALVSNVTVPTLNLYPVPAGISPSGAAVVVFPGGGYQGLAVTLEGEQPCAWYNSLGIFCAWVKYRVPFATHYPQNFAQLEDAQQAVRLVRSHAAAWHLDPKRIGVMGFSAGGHLAVTLSQHYDDARVLATAAAKEVDASLSARPDFVLLGYPAYLPVPAMNDDRQPPTAALPLDPALRPNKNTPPTFILQAANDAQYVDSSLSYATALKNAGVPVELLLYPDGGHGFGMRPPGVSPEEWTVPAAAWLRWLKVIPAAASH
ncbi:MAG: alpha/beta hydrolase [Acidobacteriaceae bacterium]|nr:alpha/beta hydrolase [Acidobacteriaceae bacterium]